MTDPMAHYAATVNRATPVPYFDYQAGDQATALATLLGAALPTAPAVSESSVTGLPAASFCRDLIANACAVMMLEAEVLDAADRRLSRPPIVDDPFVLLDQFDYWYQVFASLIMHGNWVGVPADFDSEGRPRQAVPVHPSNVSVDQSSGFPLYRIGRLTLPFTDVVHIAAKRPIGSYWGLGVIEQFRTQFKKDLYGQTYESNSHATGAVPSAIITLKGVREVKREVATQVQDDWVERHGAGQRRPAVVPEHMEVTPLSWSPADAEFIESRQLSIGETAYMFGLHPSDIGAVIASGGSTLTYENLTVRQLARLTDSYAPWLYRVERSWSRLLPRTQKVRGNPEALQRMSRRERLELRKLAQEIGVETAAESRLEERGPDAPPVPSPEDNPDDPNTIPDITTEEDPSDDR